MELQQSSNITYRIYDWDRPRRDGRTWKLHWTSREVLDYRIDPEWTGFSECKCSSTSALAGILQRADGPGTPG